MHLLREIEVCSDTEILFDHIRKVAVPKMHELLDNVLESKGGHMDNRLSTFEATDGTILKLRPVRDVAIERRQQRIEDAMREEGAQLDPPTRTVLALGGLGDAVEVPLNENNLEVVDNPEQTARNKELWKRYQDAVVKLSTLQSEERIKTMLALGVDVDVPPIEEWRDELEYIGVDIPDHPRDRKAYWLLFIVLNDYDLNVLLSQLQMIGMGKAVSGEDVESFQTAVQSEMGESIKSLVREAQDRLSRAKARVESASEIPGDEGGEELGATA